MTKPENNSSTNVMKPEKKKRKCYWDLSVSGSVTKL